MTICTQLLVAAQNKNTLNLSKMLPIKINLYFQLQFLVIASRLVKKKKKKKNLIANSVVISSLINMSLYFL